MILTLKNPTWSIEIRVPEGPWGPKLGSEVALCGMPRGPMVCVEWHKESRQRRVEAAEKRSTVHRHSATVALHYIRCCCELYSELCIVCIYTSIYYILYRKFLCPALYGQSGPNFNGQDKMPGHDGVTANCKLFFYTTTSFFSSNIISRLAMLLFAS